MFVQLKYLAYKPKLNANRITSCSMCLFCSAVFSDNNSSTSAHGRIKGVDIEH